MSVHSHFGSAQTIGYVEAVSPSEVVVLLDPSAPQASALNGGRLQRFPRINSWVLIASEIGFTVGVISWVGAQTDRVTNGATGDRVDLPFPSRRMRLAPIGTLLMRKTDGRQKLVLERGVSGFPCVGDPVHLPDDAQMVALANSVSGAGNVHIGASTLASDAPVNVDVDLLFGRHLAVLGNTGSGKSCSVAGLIRWSLDAANEARALIDGNSARARFVVFDPNGEYRHGFSDMQGVRVFRPEPTGDESPLVAPGWMWNSAEWSALARASAQTQRPLLQNTLRNLKGGSSADTAPTAMMDLDLRGFLEYFRNLRVTQRQFLEFPGHKNVTQSLSGLVETFTSYEQSLGAGEFATLLRVAEDLCKARTPYSSPYSTGDIDSIIAELETHVSDASTPLQAASEDAPLYFDVDNLPAYMRVLSRTGEFAAASGHATFLITRISSLLSDPRLRGIICPADAHSLAEWLVDVFGPEDGSVGQVTIIDLSLLASDVVHTVVAVIARVIFEALQQLRRLYGRTLPTVLVLEEAHSFVSAVGDQAEIPTTRDLCRQVFERIAREGRKFGLGLVVSSQRPSELSSTVLSQCNSFLLHRIVNDRDQDLVARLVPDTFGGLLKELPSLPSRRAVLLGRAAILPTLIDMRELPEDQRPLSADPQFWSSWVETDAPWHSWEEVQAEWVGASAAPAGDATSHTDNKGEFEEPPF